MSLVPTHRAKRSKCSARVAADPPARGRPPDTWRRPQPPRTPPTTGDGLTSPGGARDGPPGPQADLSEIAGRLAPLLAARSSRLSVPDTGPAGRPPPRPCDGPAALERGLHERPTILIGASAGIGKSSLAGTAGRDAPGDRLPLPGRRQLRPGEPHAVRPDPRRPLRLPAGPAAGSPARQLGELADDLAPIVPELRYHLGDVGRSEPTARRTGGCWRPFTAACGRSPPASPSCSASTTSTRPTARPWRCSTTWRGRRGGCG